MHSEPYMVSSFTYENPTFRVPTSIPTMKGRENGAGTTAISWKVWGLKLWEALDFQLTFLIDNKKQEASLV